MAAAPAAAPARQKQQAVDFNEAIRFVNKVKARFPRDATVYKQFLEILQSHSKHNDTIEMVHEQVKGLFQGQPDLMDEFTKFLPDAAKARVADQNRGGAAAAVAAASGTVASATGPEEAQLG